jgi:hypothetical protein
MKCVGFLTSQLLDTLKGSLNRMYMLASQEIGGNSKEEKERVH